MTILVVDDSETMRFLLRRELRTAGWDDVEEVGDAAAALEILSAGAVEFVLADWNMPDIGGLELLREAQRRGMDSKVGFITCEASPQLRSDALEAGAEFLLTKPIGYEELDWNIRRAMGLPTAGEAPAGGRRRSLDEVLSGLFQRDVTVTSCDPPRAKLPRTVAVYRRARAGGESAGAVVEMPLAASFGCALARIPGRQVEEWSSAHVLSGAVERSFLEVANVLAPFVSSAEDRHVLRGVSYRSEGSTMGLPAGDHGWRLPVHVEVEGYGAGRLAFVELQEAGDLD